MTQPPQSPQSPPPSEPHGQPDRDGTPPYGAPQPSPQQGGGSGPDRGPIPAIVGCGLLVLVLLLALGGFFGVRALMGDGDHGEQTSAPGCQATSPSI